MLGTARMPVMARTTERLAGGAAVQAVRCRPLGWVDRRFDWSWTERGWWRWSCWAAMLILLD